MGNMNISQGQPAIQKPATNATKPAQSSTPAQASSGTASHEQDPFLGHKLCDQTQAPGYKDKLEKLPPVAPPAPAIGFGSDPGKTVERILGIGVQHSIAREQGYMIKTPDVEFHLGFEMDDMTPGEMDDLRDAIVDRMASPDTSQREREVLKRMYDFVDNATDDASGLKPDIRRIIDDLRPHVICVMPEPPGGHGFHPVEPPPGVGHPGKPAPLPPGLHKKDPFLDGKPGFPGRLEIQELDIEPTKQQEILQKLKQAEKKAAH